ncbi:HD-GYP domain-containing protein [Clostridium sp. DJ247]|uniref:HD-GYP domain-containing protein n=1 Tax=Clostridium sp. DJ247 TaxID=2726188 RepID=UPI001627EAEB|nr:HD-GYP domain-containing protein [Clostridium sp. DJ247]MBC2578843.1 HD-GYP domain-containing protein [Clostridium sp. DJ247]
MITLHQPIENNINVSQDIDRNIKKLCMLLKYDVATVIHFNDRNKIVTSKRAFMKKGTEYVKLKKEWTRVIKKSSKNMLNLVREKKQIILYNNNNDEDDKYIPLTESASAEIYIPIFLNKKNSKDLIASIYLATFNNINNVTKIDDIIQGEVNDVIGNIENLYQIVHLRKQRNESILNLINMMSEITREKEPFMILHPYHVAQFSTEIGKSLNLNEETASKLYLAGILHDIGKTYLDSGVLNKEGSLTEEEYETLKNHSIYGANIVKDVTGLEDISLIVRHHHERYDGTGYPDGLKDEEIPFESRVICVADAVDAMISHRSYRSPQSVDFVITELLKNRGKQFDPKIADSMISILTKTKDEITEIFSDSIVWSTLIITTEKKVHSIEGTLGKYDFGYFFKADKFNFLSEINRADITSISLYINKNNNIVQYQLKLDYFEENIVHISEFKYIQSKDSFSILWDLSGELYLNTYDTYVVKICKLGGSGLMFCLIGKQIEGHMENKILSLKILFENNKSITVSGKIIRSFKVANTNYYEFTYIDVRDSIIDEIFREIFNKQTQIKRLISNFV